MLRKKTRPKQPSFGLPGPKRSQNSYAPAMRQHAFRRTKELLENAKEKCEGNTKEILRNTKEIIRKY